MTDNTKVALISGLFGVIVALAGPVISNWVKRMANGRVDAAHERQQFYRDLQGRLIAVEAELYDTREKCNELERTIFLVEELREDMAELRALIDAHLAGHPKYSLLMSLLERMTVRMGKHVV